VEICVTFRFFLQQQNLQKDQGSSADAGSQQQSHQKDRHSSKSTHDEVSNIFKLISDKETAKLGLKQLYDFKEKHPSVDIQPFLRGASPYFQQYINEGLAELQSQNNTNNNQFTGSSGGGGDANGDRGSNPDSDYWMSRLNMYRKRGMLNPNQDDHKLMAMIDKMDNKTADENLNVNQIRSRKEVSF